MVGEHPYRERFVAQLMLALYRAGRHAEALEVYERTRRALADDLGLQPSAELQLLSAQIVRQEPHLRPSPPVATAAPARLPAHRARRLSGLVLGAAVAAAAVALTASGSAPTTVAATQPPLARAALVLPRSVETSRDEVLHSYANAFGLAQFGSHPLKTTTLVVDDREPRTEQLAAAAATLRSGRFSLVIWVGDGAGAKKLAPLVRTLPRTRFVYLDASLETLALNRVPNATAVRFAEEESSELVGYLSGLVAPRGRAIDQRADVVSVVGAMATPQAQRMVAGFTRGVRRALPDVRVLVDYSGDADDRTPCERLANKQIDRGSDVVFSIASRCGAGALAVARARGVWAAADDTVSSPRPREKGQSLGARTSSS